MTKTFVGRPRIRLQAPAVIFKVSASLQPPALVDLEVSDPFLPSGVPLASNLLQPLESDALLKGTIPQLSSMRLSRRSPVEESLRREAFPLKVITRRPCRAIPVLSSRIKVQKSPFRVGMPTMIAALEMDVPAFAQHPIEIVDAIVTLTNGIVYDMSEGQTPKLPMVCYAKDQLVCLYKLSPSSDYVLSNQPDPQTLDVSIGVRVMVSDECHPQVKVRFKANVDFSTPSGQHTKQQSIQSGNKPPNILSSTVKQEDQLMQTAGDVSKTAHEHMGVIIKFTAKGEVYVGEPFQWEVFVINRSGKQRRLGLSMLYKRKTGNEKRISSRPTSINANTSKKMESIADAFVDDNLLYTMIKTHGSEATQLVCLNTDVRIG
jgi:hypothetical protein